MPLANVRVNAAVTFVNNANVTDRRVGVAPFRSAIGVLAGNINLLVNGGAEYWTKGVGPITVVPNNYIYQFTDGWLIFNGSTAGFASASKETTIVDQSKASAKIDIGATTATDVVMTQRIEDFTQFQAKPFSFSARVRVAANFNARVRIRETNAGGRLDTYSPYHPGGSVWQTLAVTKLLRSDNNNTSLEVSIVFALPSTISYVDNAMLVVSGEAVEYLPLPPADDQARGERYLQKISIEFSGYAPVAGIAGYLATTVPYRRTMGGTPSATITTVGSDANVSSGGMNLTFTYGGSYFVSPTAVGWTHYARDIILDWYI